MKNMDIYTKKKKVAKMTNVKYKDDAVHMARIFIAGVKVLQDIETGTLYYDICDECEMLLDENELGYGHECQ